jgi:ferredoxin
MPRKVSDECIACGACVDTCPVAAITLNDKAEIDKGACIDCGACEGDCPVSAISEA